MRNHLLGVAIAFGAAACATEAAVPDELAGESEADDAGKSDGAGTFTYWQVEVAGGGYRVSRPNRTVNECGNGVRGASCDVAALDFAGTAMPDSVAKGHEDRLRDGESILLRGELEVATPEVAFTQLSRTAGTAIADADLVPAVPVNAPSIHVGDLDGPDCLYARLFVKDVDVSGAAITVTPSDDPSVFAFDARFDGVSLPSTTEHAVACVNGTSTLTVRASSITVSGVMTVAANGSLSFARSDVRVNGMTIDSATPPPSVVPDMLFGTGDDALGNIVLSSVGLALEPLVKNARNAHTLAVTEVWLPGSDAAADLSGVFVLATKEATGVRERRINSTRFATIEELDLAASGADADVVERANAALENGDEVLLVGFRYIEGGKHGRAANQFWTKAPVPQF